jgi:SAM-dependent methyltransferase
MFQTPFKADFKTKTLLNLVAKDVAGRRIRQALVVGCGDGHEAGVLANVFDCAVVAIDVDDRFECKDPRVQFQLMDACRMEFKDASFDLVYSFHALEHIASPAHALNEMARVLAANGFYCVGTPNRSRLLGYIGSANTSWAKKLCWNLKDWKARLSGRFRNELGAHAGFTERELVQYCNIIGPGSSVSNCYYQDLYARFAPALAVIRGLGMRSLVWPAVYVVGRKGAD